ncbi:MAG: hypothetical protein OXN17_01670 [Candidatus Poribacteria bacterium]|nr:hypothetical protein [Candidatus Poribacteria bacterium]MDE0505236.1 hypothetical protein [Candidatus Poribacteria bacterium]
MGETLDLGRRIEVVPMDAHFHDITVALYRQLRNEVATFVVHSYSRIDGSYGRIASIVNAMQILGGMELTSDGQLQFPCKESHELACRRVFLEACKTSSNEPVESRPLNVLDKKSGLNITVSSTGAGVYDVGANGDAKSKDRRISAIAGGLIKLGQMVDERVDRVSFSCGQPHDALVGLLLVRAPNVRAIMREQEMASSRGVLSAPSQQE